MHWLRGAVVYQVYPLSFKDGNGDGQGDLEGIMEGLPHIRDLGVDALWVSPFYPSPLKDFGYDVTDHRDVDPRMGSLETFDRLVSKAHDNGLRVMIDLICGHTSDQHAWFQDSRRSKQGSHADWYVWADPQPDGTPPNNWLSVFGGSAWSWEPRRRQYYLHHFLSSQPTLNLRSPAVVEEILDTARFWLDRGVDGFRLDAVDFLMRDPELRSNPPANPVIADVPAKLFGLQRHDHDMMHADIRGVLEKIRQVCDGYHDRVLLGELSSQPGSDERIASYTRPGRLHAAYTLAVAKSSFSPRAFAGNLKSADPLSTCWSLSNHDVERATSRWRPAGADPMAFDRLLSLLMACLPGTVCVYQGEELGLPQADLCLEDLRDPFGISFWPEFKGRDGSRTPLPWRSDERFAGFGKGEAPWLPVCRHHLDLSVDRQEGVADSHLSAWRSSLALRRRYPVLVSGSVERVHDDGRVLAFERVQGDQRVLCVFNLTNSWVDYPLPSLKRPMKTVVNNEAQDGQTSDHPDLICEVIAAPACGIVHGGSWIAGTQLVALPPFGALIAREIEDLADDFDGDLEGRSALNSVCEDFPLEIADTVEADRMRHAVKMVFDQRHIVQ